MNDLGLSVEDFNALMALSGLICGLLIATFTAIALKVIL